MGLEYWPVVATGVVILIAIAASNRALRGEMSDMRRELGGRITEVHREMSGRIDALSKRVHGLGERVTEVRERLGRVEGLLERHRPAQRTRRRRRRLR